MEDEHVQLLVHAMAKIDTVTRASQQHLSNIGIVSVSEPTTQLLAVTGVDLCKGVEARQDTVSALIDPGRVSCCSSCGYRSVNTACESPTRSG